MAKQELLSLNRWFTIHNGSIHLWREDTDNGRGLAVLRQLMRGLVNRGWKIGHDPRIRLQYKCLDRYHRRGNRGGLEVKANTTGRCVEVEFFQNVTKPDNPNGGEYDFNRLPRMPYLLRLRTLFELAALREQVVKLGFADNTAREPQDAYDRVQLSRKSWQRSHPRMFEVPPENYNATDADGRIMRDGDTRFTYDWGNAGHIHRGQVFHDGNNMWFIVANASTWTRVSSGMLFAWDPSLHPRRKSRNAQKSLKTALARAVESEDFERAIGIRNAKRRSTSQTK